ncbi:hypothetical protein DET0056 [Dehalococcoides mccartyi 195]|uniref:Uncharacterized protein n=1 Tax=Dehalococcoides mccartyi (strain ATCC BAA-2266 / KCTC 15142 / 195) TaxID=243164 RepID=Q3ZAE0_DEHM1|nr:hypothetical protein DET0056 [Dehalococcoides mccartyi 195]
MPLPGELCFFIHLKAGSIFPLAAPIKNKACRGPFFYFKADTPCLLYTFFLAEL